MNKAIEPYFDFLVQATTAASHDQASDMKEFLYKTLSLGANAKDVIYPSKIIREVYVRAEPKVRWLIRLAVEMAINEMACSTANRWRSDAGDELLILCPNLTGLREQNLLAYVTKKGLLYDEADPKGLHYRALVTLVNCKWQGDSGNARETYQFWIQEIFRNPLYIPIALEGVFFLGDFFFFKVLNDILEGADSKLPVMIKNEIYELMQDIIEEHSLVNFITYYDEYINGSSASYTSYVKKFVKDFMRKEYEFQFR